MKCDRNRKAPTTPIAALLRMAALIVALCASEVAAAQEMYDSSVPASGDVLRQPPERFSITFSEAIHLNQIRLLDAQQREWPIDWLKSGADVFSVEFRATTPLPPGHYVIDWRATVRQHFHDDAGEIHFTILP